MSSYCIALGTLFSHLGWSRMEDNAKKRMCTCMCDSVSLLYSKKLTEHRKPVIMDKIKIIKKINEYLYNSTVCVR